MTSDNKTNNQTDIKTSNQTDIKTMTCEQFQSQLSDLVGSGADIENHPHVKECDICRRLYQELQTIADAARQMFPDQQPEDKLWERIETAIKEEDGVSGHD